MMKGLKRIICLCSILIFTMWMCIYVYAESVDAAIPMPENVLFESDGTVTWDISNSGTPTATNPTGEYIYKKFQVKLMKRYAKYSTATSDTDYEWKDFGSTKTITVSENNDDEYFCTVEVGTPGFYVAKVRACTVENIYSSWSDPSNSAAFDSATTNISISDGSSVASNYGPGTVYGGDMQVQNPYQNYGGAANIIGANGQYITSAGQGSAYIYDNSYQSNINYQGQSTANIGIGPGVRNGATQDTFSPGPGTNYQVQTGISNSNISSPNYTGMGLNNTNQIVQSGPSQSGNNFSAYTNQNWSTEVGWHVDANGFYYYQGNGVYLRNQWYLIENNYYRFNEQGYALISKWFKDPSNNAWYYMGAEGKMLTGWQYIDNVWYYLNPDRGTNYGVMYCNCTANIGGKYYAFNSEGGCILNGYYNGNYYGADGSRQY